MTCHVPRSFKVIWGHWPRITFGALYHLWWRLGYKDNVLAHFDYYLFVSVDLKASKRYPSPVPILKVALDLWAEVTSYLKPCNCVYWLTLIERNTLALHRETCFIRAERLRGDPTYSHIHVRCCKTQHTGESKGCHLRWSLFSLVDFCGAPVRALTLPPLCPHAPAALPFPRLLEPFESESGYDLQLCT